MRHNVEQAGYDRVRIVGDAGNDLADVCRLTCLEQGIKIVDSAGSELPPTHYVPPTASRTPCTTNSMNSMNPMNPCPVESLAPLAPLKWARAHIFHGVNLTPSGYSYRATDLSYPIAPNPLIRYTLVTHYCLWALDIMETAVHPVENVVSQDLTLIASKSIVGQDEHVGYIASLK